MKKLLSLCISLGLLALIYWRIDARGILHALQACDPLWLMASLAMVIPLTALTAWRFRQLVRQPDRIGLAEATRLTLAASTLNLVLPSKMGDIAKGYFLVSQGGFEGSSAFALVVFEKAFDLLSLLVWCGISVLVLPQVVGKPVAVVIFALIGLLTALMASSRALDQLRVLTAALLPGRLAAKFDKSFHSASALQTLLWASPAHTARLALTSLLLWFLHLSQIGAFTRALGAHVPLLEQMAYASLSILAGLLPLTFAGVGTRDAAAIALYSGYLSPPAGAALGLLMTSRYLMPGLAGLPFLGRYIALPKRSPAARVQ